jgi:prephenate dehydrogenase
MATIVCGTCGREVDTRAPVHPLVAEERRCPRCGRSLAADWAAGDKGERDPSGASSRARVTREIQTEAERGPSSTEGPVRRLPFERIAFIGFGLIGGSIAKALRGWERYAGRGAGQQLHLSAWSPSRAGSNQARTSGLLDVAAPDAVTATRDAELVVLAGPPVAILQALDAMAGPWAEEHRNTVVTDVGSTKAAIVAQAAAAGIRFVGGHPMAGRTTRGFHGASATLFAGRPWILCPEGARPEDLDAVETTIRAIGAEPVRMSAAAHDAAVAAVSHVPLLASVALVEALGDELLDDPVVARLAASGWRSATRLAGGSADMGAGIAATNREAIVPRLHALRDAIDGWIAALDANAGNDAKGPDDATERLGARFEAAREALEAITELTGQRPGGDEGEEA